ncbi:MAG: hypothetical protein OXT67_01555 [Zetaproteobacteria bacterium]|nr:hypothetical protein [Zetaproteobacteria bacterium]
MWRNWIGLTFLFMSFDIHVHADELYVAPQREYDPMVAGEYFDVRGPEISLETHNSAFPEDQSRQLGYGEWYEHLQVSFTLKSSFDYYPGVLRPAACIEVVDAHGKQWNISPGKKQVFKNVVAPVRIKIHKARSPRPSQLKAKLTEVIYHFGDPKHIHLEKGQIEEERTVYRLGGSTPGIFVEFLAQLRLFENYQEPSCQNIDLISPSGTVSLNHTHLSAVVVLQTPIEVRTSPFCFSSRRTDAENSKLDFTLDFGFFKPKDFDRF